MANPFPINSAAKLEIKSSVAITVTEGRGVVLTGSLSADGFPLVGAPSGADAVIHGVTTEADFSDTIAGKIILRGQAPVKLLLGSVGVTKGDPLRVKDNTGVWELAPAGSQNVYYEALQTKAGNTFCYALPIASKAI